MISKDSPMWMCSACDNKFDSPPVNETEAHQIVQNIIKDFPLPAGDEDIITESNTLKKKCEWAVFYSSKRYIETGDFKYAVAGNAPFIVLKKTGQVFSTGTAYPIEHYINHFEKTGDPYG